MYALNGAISAPNARRVLVEGVSLTTGLPLHLWVSVGADGVTCYRVGRIVAGVTYSPRAPFATEAAARQCFDALMTTGER